MHQSKFILAQSDENTFYSKISYAIYSKIRLRQNQYVYNIQLDCIRATERDLQIRELIASLTSID